MLSDGALRQLLVRDGAELLLAVAVAGMLAATVARLRRGRVGPARCPGCGRTVARVYDACPHCDHPVVG